MIVVDVRPGDAQGLHESFGDRRQRRAQIDARRDRRAGLEHETLLAVLGIEPVDDAGALDRHPGVAGQLRGERLVCFGEASRVAPLDGAQKADHLVAGEDRRVQHSALPAGDHLSTLLGRQRKVVVVS